MGTPLGLFFLWVLYFSAYIQLCVGLVMEEWFPQQVEWNLSIRIAVDVLFEGFNTWPQYLAMFLAVIHIPNALLTSIDFTCSLFESSTLLCYSTSILLPFLFPFFFTFSVLIFSIYFHLGISFPSQRLFELSLFQHFISIFPLVVLRSLIWFRHLKKNLWWPS